MPPAESESKLPVQSVDAEFLLEVLNRSRTPLFVKNEQHQLLVVNDALCELVGLRRDQIVGKTDFDLYPEDQARNFCEMDTKVFETGEPSETEEVITDSGAITRTLQTKKNLLATSSGERMLVGTIHDISELRAAQIKLEDTVSHLSLVALTDSLTGLFNREQFETALTEHIAVATENDEQFAVLFLDLNGFKLINDTAGHQVGDEILKITADRLRNLFRSNARIARVGGDEFLVMLPRTGEANAIGLIQRIVDSLKRPLHVNGTNWNVACSIGAAVFPRDGRAGNDLIRNADFAMYEAKKRKHSTPGVAVSTYEFFRKKIGTEMQRLQHLELALTSPGMKIQQSYQPIVGKSKGVYQIRGFESLARWELDGVAISPAEFIPILERCGAIVQFGYRSIETACQYIAEHGGRDQFVSVNTTYKQILEHDFCSTVAGIIRETGIPAHRLALELTEQDANVESQLANSVFKKLQRIGVRTVIDDFGSGYSNLVRLGQYPIDIVKIDKQILGDLRLLRSMLRMLQEMEFATIVEGIENEAMLESVESLGVKTNMLQGFLFGTPQTADYDWKSSVLQPPCIETDLPAESFSVNG